MKLDFKSLSFGYSLKNGSSTPAWETSLGQGKGYKLKEDNGINELVKGMVYKAVPSKFVSFKKGKGGAFVSGDDEKSSLVIASVFDQVYVNERQIDGGKFILLISKDDSKSHSGRLKLKYGPDNKYVCDGVTLHNQMFIDLVKIQLGLASDACWFVSDISIHEQDKLVFKTTIINPDGSEEYEDSQAHHQAWNIEPSDEYEAHNDSFELNYETNCDCKGFSRNRIIFGAPGTGKSYTINKEKDELISISEEFERVTFHPDYSYANFVGTYKPVASIDSDGKDAITYEYVPGPFMRTLVKALRNANSYNPVPYLLIIEEINRANMAAVFGDVFQLLDRDDNEVSEYPIQASEDMKKYLAKELGGNPQDYSEIKLPNNMFIWATMNSADQGVFPMDTAFKRRWDFTYIGINENQEGVEGKTVRLGKDSYEREVEWNKLRMEINKELLKYKVNEDKLMGPYFIAKKTLGAAETIDADTFIKVFKNKVIMYLFDDAGKQKRPSLFAGCEEKNLYSAICSEFDEKGVYIFADDISKEFNDKPGDE